MGFCRKDPNCVHFELNDLVQISPACGSNVYQIMYEGTLDFVRKSVFPAFYVTITDIGRLKSLHSFFDKYLNHMLVKFE